MSGVLLRKLFFGYSTDTISLNGKGEFLLILLILSGIGDFCLSRIILSFFSGDYKFSCFYFYSKLYSFSTFIRCTILCISLFWLILQSATNGYIYTSLSNEMLKSKIIGVSFDFGVILWQ